jgi:fructose-1,6-bisphosphatase/inositol monophosphatase family enzyme
VLPTRKFRSLGSICLELAYVAGGGLDLVVADRPHLWDIAPGTLLVEEAGGMVRTFEGDPVFPLGENPGGISDRRYRIVAGGPAAVEEVLGYLRALPL